ncbi:MAG: site-specific integrase [Novosphingobium sp.]|uniref:tyrosine-type recombinase/integrase n=1 Tax=Novosphingobium sp. TaxID=1874826 RepID=UPI0012C80C2F|nr:site-specific integrase [Novosphingobium sp.]MPS70932.1 site-specific integrase [Novosphingobium sp.]
MARRTHLLTDAKVRTLKEPGTYPDGEGLKLKISPTGSKSWTWVFTFEGRRREAGFGRYPAVSLKEARAKRVEGERLRDDDIDPIKGAGHTPDSRPATFGEIALDYIADHESGWKNDKHRQQWRNTLQTYGKPIWNMPVDQIGVSEVRNILRPIWHKKPETAKRVRGRMEKVLGAAKALGLRSGPNPASLRDNLDFLLGQQRKQLKRHHAAMPYADVPQFFSDLKRQEGLAARALELLIQTAARTSEVLHARWCEFDLDNRLWTIPAERMKAGKEHRVPLTPQVMALLNVLTENKTFLFPGQAKGKPLSNMAMSMLLRRMEIADATVHGFRSSFRDWCGESTDEPGEIAEMALGHEVGNKVEQAYRRGDALEKRRKLMTMWSDYLSKSER